MIEMGPALAPGEELVAGDTWSVEIYLTPGGVVNERTVASDPRQAIEVALARSFIVPEQVCGISARPVAFWRV